MAKIGRNDPCPCGSGKKYKKCCLAGDEAAARAARPAPPAAVEPEQAPPAELPKTASPYPAMGFTGVILLALAGLIGRRLSA